MKRKVNAIWTGDGANGNGVLTSQSGALNNMPYNFKTRFENDEGKLGTNPEELIAGALAGCFNMKLSFVLNEANFNPDELETNAIIGTSSYRREFQIKKIRPDLNCKLIRGNIDELGEILDYGHKLGLIEKSGAFYKMNGETIGQGKVKASMFLKENAKIRESLLKEIREAFIASRAKSTK